MRLLTIASASLTHFRLMRRQVGLLRAIYDASIRGINRLVFLRVLKAVEVATPDAKALERRPEFVYGFLSRAILLSCAMTPEYEMSERFLRGALAKNDRCYGILHGQTLASYGWYSTEPTVALTDDLVLSFDASSVYMYKGFTHEQFRGRRLHAAGMAQALQEYRSEGRGGIVSYVESNNYSSLKSCYRMGYSPFGDIVVLRLGGRYFIRSSAGCKSRGFVLARRPRLA